MPIVGSMLIYALAFTRMSAFLLSVPTLSAYPLPLRMRFLLAAVIGGMVTATKFGMPNLATHELPMLFLQESIIGVSLGLAVSTVVAAFQMAGSFISRMTGGNLASIGSVSGEQLTPLATLCHGLAITLLFVTNGHRMVIDAAMKTFQLVRPGVAWTAGEPIDFLRETLALSFEFAVRVSAPITFALLISGLATGLLGRLIKHVNFFGIGTSLNVVTMLVMLIAAAAVLGRLFEEHLLLSLHHFEEFLNSFAPVAQSN